MAMIRINDLEARLEARRAIDPDTGCWNWTGEKNNHGYGRTSIGNSVRRLVHRISYEREVGPIPEGMVLDHLCRNRACFNPSHLEPVTVRENAMRSPLTLASINSAKTHCPRGHEYTPENTAIYKSPGATNRRCRACDHERDGRSDGIPA